LNRSRSGEDATWEAITPMIAWVLAEGHGLLDAVVAQRAIAPRDPEMVAARVHGTATAVASDDAPLNAPTRVKAAPRERDTTLSLFPGV